MTDLTNEGAMERALRKLRGKIESLSRNRWDDGIDPYDSVLDEIDAALASRTALAKAPSERPAQDAMQRASKRLADRIGPYGMDVLRSNVEAKAIFDSAVRALAASDPELLREPGQPMLEAARDWSRAKYGKPIGNDAAIGCWQAMLDALVSRVTPAETPSDNGLKDQVRPFGENLSAVAVMQSRFSIEAPAEDVLYSPWNKDMNAAPKDEIIDLLEQGTAPTDAGLSLDLKEATRRPECIWCKASNCWFSVIDNENLRRNPLAWMRPPPLPAED